MLGFTVVLSTSPSEVIYGCAQRRALYPFFHILCFHQGKFLLLFLLFPIYAWLFTSTLTSVQFCSGVSMSVWTSNLGLFVVFFGFSFMFFRFFFYVFSHPIFCFRLSETIQYPQICIFFPFCFCLCVVQIPPQYQNQKRSLLQSVFVVVAFGVCFVSWSVYSFPWVPRMPSLSVSLFVWLFVCFIA